MLFHYDSQIRVINPMRYLDRLVLPVYIWLLRVKKLLWRTSSHCYTFDFELTECPLEGNPLIFINKLEKCDSSWNLVTPILKHHTPYCVRHSQTFGKIDSLLNVSNFCVRLKNRRKYSQHFKLLFFTINSHFVTSSQTPTHIENQICLSQAVFIYSSYL